MGRWLGSTVSRAGLAKQTKSWSHDRNSWVPEIYERNVRTKYSAGSLLCYCTPFIKHIASGRYQGSSARRLIISAYHGFTGQQRATRTKERPSWCYRSNVGRISSTGENAYRRHVCHLSARASTASVALASCIEKNSRQCTFSLDAKKSTLALPNWSQICATTWGVTSLSQEHPPGEITDSCCRPTESETIYIFI